MTDDDWDDDEFEKLEDRLESLGLLPDGAELRGEAERDILRSIATRDRPLADPDGFPDAHRTFVRALEAIAVHGRRSPTLGRRARPFRAVLAPLVSAVSGWIIDGQVDAVHGSVLRLYEFREAGAVWNGPEHRLLRRARMQMALLRDELRASRLTLPVFLLSGAFVSGVLSVAQRAVEPALGNILLSVLLGVLVVVLLVGIAGTVLLAASVARLRLRLTLSRPLANLYRAIGSAGEPPEDRCFTVAILALAFFAVAAIVVPAGIVFLLHL
ncbi:MAG: hypothetical protein AB7O78_00425 [Thermoleophilia bacterium]